MADAVLELVEAMHLDFAHSVPAGFSMKQMADRWGEVFVLYAVPSDRVMECYLNACQRRRERDANLAAFMPAVFELVNEWRYLLEAAQRDNDYHAQQQKFAADRVKAPVVIGDGSTAFERMKAKYGTASGAANGTPNGAVVAR